MKQGETDYKGKFWVGQQVSILNDSEVPRDDCAIGTITNIKGIFTRLPDIQVNEYTVVYNGIDSVYNMKAHELEYVHISNGNDLEPVENK